MRRSKGPWIVTLTIIILMLSCIGCNEQKTEIKNLGIKLDSSYMMATFDVKTFISDSGLVQFKLQTKEWYIYDKGTRPHWYFPKKIYVEKFDSLNHTLAFVKADTAYYYTNDDLWKLVGHVEVKNIQGEQFFTPRIYWDKRNQNVYTHDTVLIIRSQGILRGRNLQAKQDMSSYTILQNSGTFNVDDNSSEDNSSSLPENQENEKKKKSEPLDPKKMDEKALLEKEKSETSSIMPRSSLLRSQMEKKTNSK